MKYKILVSLLIGILTLSPITVHANDTDLEARVQALEERVATLESQINSTPEGVSAVPEQEKVDPGTVETGMVDNGCSLTYKRFEISEDYSGDDIVILYFDFFNGSGRTTSADYKFEVKVFQNDREQSESIAFDNEAGKERYTEFRSGADPVEVAYASNIQDMSDIIVNISNPFISNGDDFVEFTLSLE